MAFEEESARANGGEGGVSGVQAAALERRVARLEVELADLQRRMSSEVVTGAETARPAFVEPPPVPIALPKQVSPGELHRAVTQDPAKFHARVTGPDADLVRSFEDRLGSQIFNRIAIVLLLIGTAYGLKLAVDRGFLGPAERVLIGLVAGAGLVIWSERFRSKGFDTFSYSLKAVGSGILYLSLWAAFQIFHLLPAPAALAMMILVTAWNAYMAWAQDGELLAAYALAGGLATPLLVSTGGNHEIFLFSYLLAIDVATVVLVRLKRWPRLLLGAFPATVLFFIGWYTEFYAPGESAVTSMFIVLFGAVFASVSLGWPPAEENEFRVRTGTGVASRLVAGLEEIFLPLGNAAFVGLAFYSVLQDSGHHGWLPWLMLAVAAVYLGLMRVPQTQTVATIHLSLAVVFLTIAIPLKASGHWITVSWLVEGLALTWAAARLGADERAGRTLRWLASASLLLGFSGVCVHLVGAAGEWNPPLLHKANGTALTGIAVFAATAWLALRMRWDEGREANCDNREEWSGVAKGAALLVAATAGLLTLREVATSWFIGYAANIHLPFRSADFISALVGLGVLGGVVKASLEIARQGPDDLFWRRCAAGATIAFNLTAVLTGVREVSAVWNASPNTWSAEDALKQALAVSAFLMLYGAALLAAGFWKRTALLRWQALALLVFTICKTFLYDMRSLSEGYRVASVFGLGVVLMAISFAYQKDWLNLREPEETTHAAASPVENGRATSEAAE